MTQSNPNEQLFHEYFEAWIETYKKGAVRPVTYNKYLVTLKQLRKFASDLKISEIDKMTYQTIINQYAMTHHKTTTRDFHNQIKAAVLDLVDEGILPYNPARTTVIKGYSANNRKENIYLNKNECKKLISNLDLASPFCSNEKIIKLSKGSFYKINWDWLIYLCLKTGLRFSEALGLTPADFNFRSKTLLVNKIFDYKTDRKTKAETKTHSSVRRIRIDDNVCEKFRDFVKGVKRDKPIFVPNGIHIFNSTVNHRLSVLCRQSKIPVITVHGLRHTHASLLLYSGASILSISRRLGHANPSMTQNVYLHIIKELESKDNAKITKSLQEIG